MACGRSKGGAPVRRRQPSGPRRSRPWASGTAPGAALGTLAAATLATVALPNAAAQRPAAPLPTAVSAVAPGTTSPRDTTWALIGIGTAADDARRDAQLTGAAPSTGRLFRSPSSEPNAGTVPARGWRVIPVQARVVYNSAIPYSANEGSLWAGRGANVRLRGGGVFQSGRVRLILAPEIAYSGNQGFDLQPSNVPGRSVYASAIYTGLLNRGPSADLPLRYGDRAFTNLDLGQTSLTIDAGPVAVGVATEAEWWGPGTRSALLLSTSAAGIPRLFARTARPVRTPVGAVEARWFAGTLVKSPFWDVLDRSSWRSIAALAVSLAPRGTSGLTVGASRLVVRSTTSAFGGTFRPLDVLAYWEPAPRVSEVVQPTLGGVAPPQTRADQLFSFSARQVFPSAGVEVYSEWARQYVPRSLREFVLAPHESQA